MWQMQEAVHFILSVHEP